jgi:hypothetical protein
MKVFKAKYIQSTEYGLEYFKGNAKRMMADMFSTVHILDDDESQEVEGPVVEEPVVEEGPVGYDKS